MTYATMLGPKQTKASQLAEQATTREKAIEGDVRQSFFATLTNGRDNY